MSSGVPSNYNDDYPYSWSAPAYHPSTEHYKMSKVTLFNYNCDWLFQQYALSAIPKVCPSESGSPVMNLLCAVNVFTQPEATLPDIQSSDHAVDMIKEFKRSNTKV